MVRFRLWSERSSTLKGSVAGKSLPIADRWSLGKGLALASSREIALSSLRFAFALRAGLPEFPTTWLCSVVASLSETLAPSSDFTLNVWRDAVDNLSANGALSPDEKVEFDVWSLPFDARADGRFGAREGGSDSAVVSATSRSGRRNGSSGTRLGRIRPFGDDTTSVGDGSTFFTPDAAAEARCDSRSNAPCGGLVSDDCAFGFDEASLGRRRTSTVNEGTARLKCCPRYRSPFGWFVSPMTTVQGKAQQSNRQLSRKRSCEPWIRRHQSPPQPRRADLFDDHQRPGDLQTRPSDRRTARRWSGATTPPRDR